ncbi:hypothetical protein I3842_12G091700 [Carya illinoinensis]|uniref:B3 domain-containing protein n=1 Tax=Carya illinoinensis TaxID=32201 RepID=A0A922DIG4_CARIL|nr:hypothetical protein I3842_12G091700 [Carya illinoinensis]
MEMNSKSHREEVSTELTLASGYQKESMVSFRPEREVPTELALYGGSCEIQKRANFKRETSETCDSDVASRSATMEMMPKYCHLDSDQAQQEVSTDQLTLACWSQKESMDSWRPEREVPAELTLFGGSCEFQKRDNYKRKTIETCDSSGTMKKKPQCQREYSDEAQNEVSSESTLSCGFQKEAAKESMVSWEPENEVSTELIPSCGFQPRVNKLKTSEKINDPYLFALNLFNKSLGGFKQKKSIEKTATGSKGESPVTVASKTETKRVPRNRDKQKEERTPLVSEVSWGLKKTLTAVDLSKRDRLVLPTRMVHEHILPFLYADLFKQVESKAGMPVTVWDQDSQSEHQFVFMMRYAYALHGDWHEDFWMRRRLKKSDIIGLNWDSHKSRFIFSVLERSQTPRSRRP